MKLSKLQLYTKVLIGLVAGVLFGMLASQLGFSDFVSSYIKPIGSVFIKLISMVVIPLVFALLIRSRYKGMADSLRPFMGQASSIFLILVHT